MRRKLVAIAGLALLLGAIDQLYRILHPDVNLVRAALVGLTAWATLAALGRVWRGLPVVAGALAIFGAAFTSVLLIDAGVLVSRSVVSGLVHVAILAALSAGFERATSEALPAAEEQDCDDCASARLQR